MVEARPSRRRPLPYYVDSDLMNLAGFNYWEISTFFYKQNYLCRVHIGHLDGWFSTPRRSINMIMIEKIAGEPRRRRTEWFFNRFDGPPLEECTPDERNEFNGRIEKTCKRMYRIPGRTIPDKLKEVIDELWSK